MKNTFVFLGVLTALAPAAAAAQRWTPPPAELIERAKRILQEVPVIDGHNDIPSKLLEFAGGDPDRADLSKSQPQFHTDFARLREGRVGAQFWSAYVENDSIRTGAALRQGIREVDMALRFTRRYPDVLELARTAADIERIERQGRIASLIGLEGGHGIDNTLSALRAYYELGVRYMTLTHNTTLSWADAALDLQRHRGLTEFGEDVVREMNRIGMFVDLSHVAEEVMLDALRVSQAPVIFSHSSAKALVAHPRNVSDRVLRLLPRNGGVIMVTFVPSFIARGSMEWQARQDSVAEALRAELNDEAEIGRRLEAWLRSNPAPIATVADVADHIDHVRKTASIDNIGIGSDFDGIDFGPVGLEDVSKFPVLFAELLRRGYSEADLKKISGQNMLRAMKQMEAVAARLQNSRPVGAYGASGHIGSGRVRSGASGGLVRRLPPQQASQTHGGGPCHHSVSI